MVLRKTLPIRKTLRQTFQVRTSRTSTLKALSTEKKWVLHSIKAAFAFSWAFGNAICYFLTGRFFTMLTGNVLILAVEVSQWNTEEMMFTAALIALFVLGSALYDGVSFWLKDEDKVVKRFVAPFLLTLGILSDVIQFATGGCSSGTSGDGCKGSDLYFLTPMGEYCYCDWYSLFCTLHSCLINVICMFSSKQLYMCLPKSITCCYCNRIFGRTS